MNQIRMHICTHGHHGHITLMILSISYVIIIVNVKSNPPPHHFGAVSSDRKLSVTLFMVTVVSTLTILPYAVYAVIPGGKRKQLSKKTQVHIRIALYVLYYVRYLVNPLIYAIRMKEFRNAVKDLICNRGPESGRISLILWRESASNDSQVLLQVCLKFLAINKIRS